jgi:hypothetical protein
MEAQKTLSSQINLEQKSAMLERSQYLILKYNSIVIKTAWYCKKNRYKDQCNRIEVPDIDLCSYTHLSFFKRNPKTCVGEKRASSTVFRKLDIHM